MFALGLQGSPRKKGNSDILLSRFMTALADEGIFTHVVDVPRRNIEPCREMTVCEKKGYCPIDDDMGREIYGFLRKADIVVAATPVFFYGVSAQLKALIDRCQTLWARRYMLKLKDPGLPMRRGYLLAVGATGGKQLFDGIKLTAKYFFDGISAEYSGGLTYRRIEGRGDINDQPGLENDITQAAGELVKGLTRRRKVLYVCDDGSALGPMAAAFTRLYAGDRFDPSFAALQPVDRPNPLMIEAMAEKGVDMAFLSAVSLEAVFEEHQPEEAVAIGFQWPEDPGIQYQSWEVPFPEENTLEAMRRVREDIERRVNAFIDS
jgi:multimeric flavodoxin WrbA/protein-tyrosine-phosphatase